MTERVQPGAKGSRYRGIEIGEAIGAGGNFVVDPANPTLSAIRYGTIDEAAFDGFSESHSATSFDVTIGPGEAFVDGWLAIDVSTTVTLQSDSMNQQVVLGWNPDAVYDSAVDSSRDDADEVLLDTKANIDAMTQEKPYIPIWEFDTDANGVTASRDLRDDGYSPAYFSTLTLAGNLLDTDEDGVLENADVDALTQFAPADAFSGYPLGADDVGTDAIGSDEIDQTSVLDWVNEQTFSGGITGLPEPVDDTDAARKTYVDAIAQGLTIKDPVAVSNHDTNIDLTSSTDPNPVDGYTLSDGERILLKHQTDATENGIYVASTATDPTTWVRAPDMDTDAEAQAGAFVFIENGTHADESYVQTTVDPVLGTDPLNFSLFARAGQITAGDGLTKSGSELSVNYVDTVVEDPQRLPVAALDDGESIEIGIPVNDGETVEVYRWGAYDLSSNNNPSGLDVELLDESDTVQASANAFDQSDTTSPVASYTNSSGSVQVFKLRAINNTGSTIDNPGVGSHFGFRVV